MNDFKDKLEDISEEVKENLEDISEDIEENIEELVEKLKQERDELSVKLHLAKMEASDEWQELEHKWAKLEAKAKQLGGAAADSTEDVRAAAALLGQEIKTLLKRIAKKV